MTDIDTIVRKTTVIYILLILAALLTFAATVLFKIPSGKFSLWSGYHILVVDKYESGNEVPESRLSALSELLEKEGSFDEIVSRYNTEIEYSNYNELRKVKLSDLEKRFNILDPRYDSYMKKIPLYFTTGDEKDEKEIYYIKTSMSEDEAVSVLDSIMPESMVWEIASMSVARSVFILPAIFILITASLVFIKKMKSMFFLFISAVWLFVILKTDISLFYAAVINIVFISYYIEIIELTLRKWFDNEIFSIEQLLNRRNALISAAVFIFSNTVIAVLNPSVKSFILFNLLFISECSVLSLDLVCSMRRAVNYMHKIFSSVPILETNKNRIFDRWMIRKPVYFYLFVLLISLPSVFLLTGKSSFLLPSPEPVKGIENGDAFTEIRLLSEYVPEKNEAGNGLGNRHLPDISDYMAHLAYQIRLPYKLDYSIPDKNEMISISHYFLNKNNFQEEKKTAYLFTDSWLRDNIIRVKESGLTGLIMSAGEHVKVVFTDTSSVINPVFFGSMYCFFYVALILMVVWKEKAGKTNYEKHILPLIKRRKQQAA